MEENDSWVKFNVGQFGYYRVQYPESDWIQFSKILQKSANVMSSSDRTSLINDAFALGLFMLLKLRIFKSKNLNYRVRKMSRPKVSM